MSIRVHEVLREFGRGGGPARRFFIAVSDSPVFSALSQYVGAPDGDPSRLALP